MKQFVLALLFFGFSTFLSYAQSPQAFKFQAVARDNAGEIINNQLVSFRISILQGSATGTSMYSETHQLTTNDFGLANLEIGIGTFVSGSFTTIDWSSGSYFLKVEMDPAGGSTYQLMGASQLLSVPYALFAENTANSGDDDWTISGDDMYSTVSGNVGIGTATPSATLDVAGHISTSNTGYSVFLGNGAGQNDDISDNFNTFVGYNTGNYNTSGDYNAAFGALALGSNTLGNENTAMGNLSLQSNQDGDNNSVLGNAALFNNTTGNDNAAMGYQAGFNGNGSGSVYLGYKAGYNNTSSNKLYIENSDSESPLIYGEFDNDILAINGSLGIGTQSPNAKLDVRGRISVSSTGNSVFLGYGAGTNDDLSSNYNNFVGYLAGNSNTVGEYNCAFGTWALNDNTDGYGNDAFGDYALINNTTGDENCAFGYISMHNNETGSGNTVMGNSALRYNVGGSNNTALGFYAGHSTTQSGSVYIGYKAGYYSNSSNKLYIENSDSNYPLIYGDFTSDIIAINGNLGIGTHSPDVRFHIVDGNDATLSSGGYLMTGSTFSTHIIMDNNEIMARNNGSVSSLNMQMDGGAFTIHSSLPEFNEFVVATDGKTGIGENLPDSKLHINTNSSTNGLRVQVSGTTKMLLHTNGSLALYNASSPGFALELQNSSADLLGRARAYSWNTYSDNRLKSNQRNIEYGLKEVLQLQPKSYDHHSSSTNEEGEFIMVTNQKEATIGFIAQEVQQVIPEAVCIPQNDSQDLWSMDYSKLIPVLTKAIQEQQEMIDEMRLEIAALKNQSN